MSFDDTLKETLSDVHAGVIDKNDKGVGQKIRQLARELSAKASWKDYVGIVLIRKPQKYRKFQAPKILAGLKPVVVICCSLNSSVVYEAQVLKTN